MYVDAFWTSMAANAEENPKVLVPYSMEECMWRCIYGSGLKGKEDPPFPLFLSRVCWSKLASAYV